MPARPKKAMGGKDEEAPACCCFPNGAPSFKGALESDKCCKKEKSLAEYLEDVRKKSA